MSEKIAIICDTEEEFNDANKVIYPRSMIKWSTCKVPAGTRVGISTEGWGYDKWFREHNYTVLEYSDWKANLSIINNYQIY